MQLHGLNISDLEATIKQINGVVDCRIVASEDEIEEIHILASHSRIPKQLVRDIESACMARFGLRIDHRKVSIAQLANDATSAASEGICLHSLGLEYTDKLVVKAEVDFQGQIYSGQAQGADTPSLRLRLVAQAILSATENAQDDLHFIIEEIRRDSLGRNQVVLTALIAIDRETEKRLVGVGLWEDSDIKAAADAILNAVGICFR